MCVKLQEMNLFLEWQFIENWFSLQTFLFPFLCIIKSYPSFAFVKVPTMVGNNKFNKK